MTEEEKQLLFTDLCARLPYGVILDSGVKLRTIDALTKVISGNGSDRKVEFVKPYLRSMSSVTDEEQLEYDYAIENNKFTGFRGRIVWGLDWLNAHHFDYRGLIEKGLAIEAPEGMYETSNIKNQEL